MYLNLETLRSEIFIPMLHIAKWNTLVKSTSLSRTVSSTFLSVKLNSEKAVSTL